MSLEITGFKVYVPAKDFELSKKFYTALGFAMSEGWGGTADFEKDGFCFRLQDYYVKDWAENFMIVLNVQDVAAWYQKLLAIAKEEEFANMVHVKPPESVGKALVMHVIDPAGVCLIFVQ